MVKESEKSKTDVSAKKETRISWKLALTVAEASECSGIGRNNFRNLIAWEKIPVIRNGNKYLIRLETLDKFLLVNEGRDLTNRRDVVAVKQGEVYNSIERLGNPCEERSA